MKIGVISMIRDPWGGSEELWYEMAKTAIAQGHEVLHLSYYHENKHPKILELERSGLILFERPGITDSRISGMKKYFQLGTNFIKKQLKNTVEQFFNEQPDVVIYNGTCFSISDEKEILNSIKKFKGKFFILGHFNEKSNLSAQTVQTMRQVYQACAAIFFTNFRDMELAKSLMGDIPFPAIVRNPVNLKDLSIVPFLDNKIIQMAMVGNLVSMHKGQDIVLHILKSQNWKSRNWQLNIYGSGVDEEYLKKIVQENHLAEKVFFHGKVNDIRQLWSKNHILLMPSRMEGMPLAIVEAMICGRPCVVTDVGGVTEWIEENITGFIAAEPDEKSFENTLEKSWKYIDHWQQMGISAHERAMQQYDPHPGQSLLDLITK